MKKYFNNERQYKEPTFIDFEKPIAIKFCDLDKFLDQYKPFHCSEVFLTERFEYGDYGNYVHAIIESKTINPSGCKMHTKDEGIFKAGEVDWAIVDRFWNYRKNYPFWKNRPDVGYPTTTYKSKSIEDLEILVEGVFVISDSDKDKIEREYNQNSKEFGF